MKITEWVTRTRRPSQHQVLCRLRRQFLWIPEFSFLPQSQGDRNNLARERELGRLLAHAAGEGGGIEIAQRAGLGTRCIRGRLEDRFENGIVIPIQTASDRGLLPSTKHAVFELLLGACMRHHSESHVGPQIALGAKAKWRADDGQDLGDANRTEERDRAQAPPSWLTAYLGDHGGLRLRPQRQKNIELREQCVSAQSGTAVQSGQPLIALCGAVDRHTRRVNRASAEQGLDALHHTGPVFDKIVVVANELLQRQQSLGAVEYPAQ